MACRCSEIAKCERDIELLNGDIYRNLNSARTYNDSTLAKYPVLSSALAGAVYADNLDRVTQRFIAIKKQHEGQLDSLQTKRSNELTRVRNRLESFRNEDRRYHEAQAQKAGR